MSDDSTSKNNACDPSPHLTSSSLCVVQEWVSTGITLGQVALGQLAAVSYHSLDNMEIRACSLSLMGKYLRLLAVQEDPIYLCALWDRHKQVDDTNAHTHTHIRLKYTCLAHTGISRNLMNEFVKSFRESQGNIRKCNEYIRNETQNNILISPASCLLKLQNLLDLHWSLVQRQIALWSSFKSRHLLH